MVSDLTGKFGSSSLQDLFGQATKLLDIDDLLLAYRYFNTYLSAGGPRKQEARLYLRKIGKRAVVVGQAYHDSGLLRQARDYYTIAVKVGEKKAPELLRRMPALTLKEFKAPPKKPAAKAEGRAGKAAELDWRRPHLTISKIPVEGDGFKVDVYADRSSPRPGEESSPIELKGNYDLDVTLLASAHFRVDEPTRLPFRIDREKETADTVAFNVTVKEAAELKEVEGPVSLCASFTDCGRAAGMVRRSAPTLAELKPPDTAGSVTPPAGTISVEPGAAAADLNVTVIAQADGDERHFWCTVQTHLLPEYRKGVQGEWITEQSTKDIVEGYMKDFAAEGIDGFTRMTRLLGAGKELFDAAPKAFREAFWKLIDGNIKFQTIQIVSTEPYFPWELMRPTRPACGNLPAERRPQPLGVEFRVGRMIRPSGVPGRQKLPLDKCYVVAPVFEGSNSLPHAQEERTWLLQQIPGDAIDPATLKTLDTELKDCRSLVHFACHGEVDRSGKQMIYLSEDITMSATDLNGLDGAAEGLAKARPLVFLNACKAGQPTRSLVGAGGLVAAFTGLGAGAVVAPLWSVKDSIAHEVAVEFYKQAKATPAVPFAEILRGLRAKAYDETVAEDSYAAYCFYGDPLAAPA